jgi:hypothetical protein
MERIENCLQSFIFFMGCHIPDTCNMMPVGTHRPTVWGSYITSPKCILIDKVKWLSEYHALIMFFEEDVICNRRLFKTWITGIMRTLGMYFSTSQQWIIEYLSFPNSRYILKATYVFFQLLILCSLYRPINLLVLNSMPSMLTTWQILRNNEFIALYKQRKVDKIYMYK